MPIVRDPSRTALGWTESVLLLAPIRIALGGLFVFAAWIKLFKQPLADTLDSPAQGFAESIKAFDIIPLETGEHVAKLLTFALPWAELICGVLLILGLFARPAALLISAQLVVFTAAILSVLARDMNISCGCFGEYDWPCESATMGWCQVWRDVVMLAGALLLTVRGAGGLSLDAVCAARGARGGQDAQPEWGDEDEA